MHISCICSINLTLNWFLTLHLLLEFITIQTIIINNEVQTFLFFREYWKNFDEISIRVLKNLICLLKLLVQTQGNYFKEHIYNYTVLVLWLEYCL
jgi:hypothetical protein